MKNVREINQITQNLRAISSKNVNTIVTELKSSLQGLSDREATIRLEENGLNIISYGKREPWYSYLLSSFLDPFILILIAIVFVSYFTDIVFVSADQRSWLTIIIISVMIITSVILRFSQEYKSQITADNLKDLVPTTTAIVRNHRSPQEIVISDVVVGDIIVLAAGDLIPADMRILQCKDLFISQSSLTGEAQPVEKFGQTEKNISDLNAADLPNILLMGTIVVSGSATAIVVATGNDTYFGMIAESISKEVGDTSFEEGVKSVSMLLIRFMLVMVPIVFLINGITKKDWLEALLFSISIAVGLTPEMLPTLVSTNLAKGAISLSKKKIIVKRLSSIQNFGAMDILCTDKTGTLTEDRIILETHLDVLGNVNDRVLRHAYLNSYYQTGLKNLLDVAVIEYGNVLGFNEVIDVYKRVDEIPFDFTRRRMSVVVESGENKRQLITKGAVEEMLAICSYVEIDGHVLPIEEELIEQVKDMVNKLNREGLRVLAVAQKNDVPAENIFSVKDESQMVLIGYVGFLDPAKKSAIPAINALHQHGVDVKILTGDNEEVTKKIAQQVGISSNQVVLGTDIEKLTDEQLYVVAAQSSILAKLSPLQKERIISVLQQHQHVVGFLGDGINDAQALKQADVGISVNTAVDIAKESADMIMLEKDLRVLEAGVVEGRRVFGNIIKYIKITASSNFGNVFSVLVASAFLPFLPMLPIQLLIQNLLYSISQIALPWDHMDEEYIQKPQKWNAKEIGRFMLHIGPISSFFDIVTFVILFFVFQYNAIDKMAFFQSGWFVVGLVTQTLIVHMIRTRSVPFFQSRASFPVMAFTGLIVAIGIVLPYTIFGEAIGLVSLPMHYYLWLGGIVGAYVLSIEVAKIWYIRKFNHWI